jgi:hypothetical protein
MIKEEIKSRINNIDYQLKEFFDDVKITESSNGQDFYFDIMVEKKDINLKLKLVIDKKDILKENIEWKYLAKYGDDSSGVERVSKKDYLFDDIKEVVDKKRFVL